MELYKLYCVLKRHTGYEAMMEDMKRRLLPEVYEGRRRRAMVTLAQLQLMHMMVQGKTW